MREGGREGGRKGERERRMQPYAITDPSLPPPLPPSLPQQARLLTPQERAEKQFDKVVAFLVSQNMPMTR